MRYSTRITTTVLVIFILLLSFSLILFFVDYSGYEKVYDIFYSELNDDIVSIINQKNNDKVYKFNEIHKILSNQYSNNLNRTKRLLDVIGETHSGFSNLYFTDENGSNLIANGDNIEVDGRERQWYKSAIEHNELVISEPYIDLITHDTVVTLSRSVYVNEQAVGVMGIDLYLNDILNELDDIFDAELILSYENEFIDSTIEDFKVGRDLYNDVEIYAENNDYFNKSMTISPFNLTINILRKEDWIHHRTIFNSIGFTSHLLTSALALFISFLFANGVLIYINRDLNVMDDLTKISNGRVIELNKLIGKLKLFIEQNKNRQVRLHDEKRKFEQQYQSLVVQHNRLEIDLNHHVKEIERLEETYRDLLTNVPDMVWVIDPAGNLRYFNDELLKQLGYSSNDLIEMKLKDIVDEIEDTLLVDILLKRNFKDFEMTLISKDKKQKIIVSVKTKRIYVNDQLYLIQGICKDISVDKQMFYDYYNMNKELYMLNDISKTLVKAYELNTILKSIVDKISVLMNFDIVLICVLNEDELQVSVQNDKHELVDNRSYRALSNDEIEVLNSEDYILNGNDFVNIQYMDHNYHQLILPLKNNENNFGFLIVYKSESITKEHIGLMKSVAINATIAIEKSKIFDKLQSDYFKMIESLVNAIEIKLKSAKGHAKQVGKLSVMLGEKFYLSQNELDEIYVAGLLHDIGKMGIEDQYFLDESIDKDVRLNVIKKHILLGRELIEDIGLTQNTIDGVFYHHLNFDLSGFPSTDLIEQPFIAQLIQLSNDFVNRSYDKSQSLKSIYREMEDLAGVIYSPDALHALENIVEDQMDELKDLLD